MRIFLCFSVVFALANGCGDDTGDDAAGERDADTVTGEDAAGAAGTGGGGQDAGTAPDAASGDAAEPEDGAAETDAGPPVEREPFEPTGEPIEADDLTWTFIDFPDTSCRDGSMAGLAVSLNSASDKVMIFLEGGGACFDAGTCLTNPANISAAARTERTGGLFARDRDDNPVADWNFVYIPYCTGDVHGGTNDSGAVEGVAGTQHFVGRRNMEAFLNRLVPTFENASQILLTGVSAGGFGTAISGELVQWAFGDIPMVSIDDSGPAMPASVVPECLQRIWRETWGFDGSFLADCGSDCPNPDDYTFDYTLHIVKRFPNVRTGLVETTGDGTITAFYGYGANDCTGNFLTAVPAADFEAGLLEFRELVQDEGVDFSTYFVDGTQHTWLSGNGLYSDPVGDGTSLVDWVTEIIEGSDTLHIGP